MNAMQIGIRLSRELTPSPILPKMVNGILQMPVIVSKWQHNKFVMQKTTTIAYKFKREFESLKRKKKSWKWS